MCGDGKFGQLGTGELENRLIPFQMLNLPPISLVAEVSTQLS